MNLICLGKKPFHKNPLHFGICADFEADNEIDNSNIEISGPTNKTSDITKRNQVCNVYHIVSEINDDLQNGNYESSLGYKNVFWFVDEVKHLKNELTLFFRSTKIDIIMNKKMKNLSEILLIVDFVRERILS